MGGVQERCRLHTSIGEVDDWLFSTSKGEDALA